MPVYLCPSTSELEVVDCRLSGWLIGMRMRIEVEVTAMVIVGVDFGGG